MAFEELRARLEQLLSERGRSAGARASAQRLYEALVETKAAIGAMADALAATGRELEAERQRLADAERRGCLAEQIGDQETVDLARIWSGKHRERVELLERKLQVHTDELRLAERQLEELTEAYRSARMGTGPAGGPPPPSPDTELDRAALELERQAREAKVQEQLAELKKKLGK
jgi:hypothetical protein